MSENKGADVIEIGTEVKVAEIKYIYATIPAEYVCVYHRILVMLADYGVDMLKDCKANCTDKNSGVIECFNMFNAAVAAKQLSGNDDTNKYGKLAATLIKFIKAKINQIYKGKDNSTSFVFPVDENGEIKAFVSCGERPKFFINPDDGELYKHKFGNGFDEHFRLGDEDFSSEDDHNPTVIANTNAPAISQLDVSIFPRYEYINGVGKPCADIMAWWNCNPIDINNTSCQYYFDDTLVIRFNDVVNLTPGVHNFKVIVKYKGVTAIAEQNVNYETAS